MSHAVSEKNDDIEVLRALAVLFIVVRHLDYLFTWNGAWEKLFAITNFWGGVDLFFCISGFVIARSLLREARGGSFFDFAVPFWIKRVWRIWPAAIFWLLVAIAASKFFNSSGAFGVFKANVEDGVAAIAQVANFHLIDCTVDPRRLCGNQAIYWSLSLEEQFYVVFPFLLFFLPCRWLMATLGGAILLQCFLERPETTPLWFVRTDAICWGVLIALAAETEIIKEKLYPYFLESKRAATIVPLVLCFFIAALSTHDVVWFDTGLIAVLCATLVFFASYDRNLILPIPVLRPVLLWVGSRSFAIYLTHMIAYWVTVEAFYRAYPGVGFDERFTAPFAVVAFALIVLLSEASYRFIERPLRDRGRIYARQYRARRPGVPTPGAPTEVSGAVASAGGALASALSIANPVELVAPGHTEPPVGAS